MSNLSRKNNPTISVVIPLFNKHKSISICIQSVLGQSYSNFEILVINDGSTDDSGTIVKGFNDQRVKLIDQVNLGVSSARNKGIMHANGQFVAFLDADDYWGEDFLQTFIDDYFSVPNINFWSCGYSFIAAESQRHARFSINSSMKRGFITDYFSGSLSDPLVTSSSVIISTNRLKDIGGFPIGEESGEDLVTWLRLSESSTLFFNRKTLSNYTFDGSTNTNLHAYITGNDWIVLQYLKGKLSSKNNSMVEYYILLVYRRSGLMIRQENYIDAARLVIHTLRFLFKKKLAVPYYKIIIVIIKLNLILVRKLFVEAFKFRGKL